MRAAIGHARAGGRRRSGRRHRVSPSKLRVQQIKCEESIVQENGVRILSKYRKRKRLTSPEKLQVFLCIVFLLFLIRYNPFVYNYVCLHCLVNNFCLTHA